MFNSKALLSTRPPKRRQHGAVAIEFAIVIPFLLLIFYGIICYSLILLHKQALTSISSEAARSTLAVIGTNRTDPQIQVAIDDVIRNVIQKQPYRITGGCEEGGGEFHYRDGDNLTVCLQASLPDNPALPTIDLSAFGLPKLPPDTTDMLKTEVTVIWRP